MAMRLKAIQKAEFEEVPDDQVEEDVKWIAVENPAGPLKEAILPFIKTAEVMVDPTKPNAYFMKAATAEKVAKKLPNYVVEDGEFVARLPIELTVPYKMPALEKAFRTALREQLAGLKDFYGVKGVNVFEWGKKPDVLKAGFLYMAVPPDTSIPNVAADYMGQALVGNNFNGKALKDFPRPIATRLGKTPFAYYTPQTIYLQVYVNHAQQMSAVCAEAFIQGTREAMAYEGGAQKPDLWLGAVVKASSGRRKADLEAERKTLAQDEAALMVKVNEIRDYHEKVAKREALIAGLRKDATVEELQAKWPLLDLITGVDTDDPTRTLFKTKDIVLEGVNLGVYEVRVSNTRADIGIIGHNKPDHIPHPNLYQEAGKWTWKIEKEKLDAIIKAITGSRMEEAISLVLENLTTLAVGGADRLAEVVKFMENKPKRGRPKKVAEPAKPEPEVATAPPIEDAHNNADDDNEYGDDE